MIWIFPLAGWWQDIPKSIHGHPGAFGAIRKHDIHTGVDLYTEPNKAVRAVENGKIVSIVDFTGEKAGSPWWQTTQAILIEGESGVVCYGEIKPQFNICTEQSIKAGEVIGFVVPVLTKEQIKKDIKNHSNFMLHLELYTTGTKEPVWWKLNEEKPPNLLDPTEKLFEALL